MEQTPLDQIEYKMWEPPTRTALPEAATGILTFSRGGRDGRSEAIIQMDGRPLEQRLVKHSPTGMEFGYGGSGPGDTALNILALVVSPKEANRLHQDFKWAYIAPLPREGGSIRVQDVLDWVRDRYALELADSTRMAREAEQRKDAEELARLDAQEAEERTTNV